MIRLVAATSKGLSRVLSGGLKSETAYTAAGNFLLLAGGFASGVLSARLLAPNGRGQFLAIYTWAGIVGLILGGGSFHSLAMYTRRGLHYRKAKRYIARHLCLTAAASAGLFGGIVAAQAVSWMTPVHAIGGSLAAVSLVVAGDLAGVAIGYGQLRTGLQRVRLLPVAFGLGAMIMLATTGNRSPGHWLLLTGLAQVVPSVVGLALLRPNPSMNASDLSTPALSDVARSAVNLYFPSIATHVNYRLDLLLLSVLLPTAGIANYGVAASAGMAVASIGQAVGLVQFRRFAAPDGGHGASVAMRRSARHAATLSAAIAVPLAFAAPKVVRFVYGDAYGGAVVPTVILVLAAIPLSADYLLLQAFLGLQRLRTVYVTLGVTSVMTVGGLAIITAVTYDLGAIAAISPGTYICSVWLLLRFSRVGANPGETGYS